MYHCVFHLLHNCVYLGVRSADSNHFSGVECGRAGRAVAAVDLWLQHGLWSAG